LLSDNQDSLGDCGPRAAFICAYLPRGSALGILSTSLLRFGENLSRLKVLPVDLPITPWPVVFMSLKNRTLTPVVRLFMDCTREVAKPLARKAKSNEPIGIATERVQFNKARSAQHVPMRTTTGRFEVPHRTIAP
jgi:hypothetical protein